MKRFLVVAALLLVPAMAQAQILNFEGVGPYPTRDYPHINSFYDGGTSSAGYTGTNYGIEFSSNALAICLNAAGMTWTQCSNTSRGGLGNPTSQQGGLFFLTGGATYMNRAAGFENGFSFFYTAVGVGGSFDVWSDLNGTGTHLASLALGTTASACDYSTYGADFCPFVAAGVSFSGEAKSVTFSGVADQIVFDDVTFGSPVPDELPNDTVPEPITMTLLGTGLSIVGIARRKRQRS